MKKDRFKQIVSSYSSTPEEIKSLEKLATDYPFSQIVHLLLANATKKEDQKSFKQSLSNAALHSTDRSILKSLIEHNLVPSEIVERRVKTTVNKLPAQKASLPKPVQKAVADGGDSLREDVLKNLELLIKTKKEFSVWFEEEHTISKTSKAGTTPKPAVRKATPSKKEKTTKKTNQSKTHSKIIDEFIEKEPTISKNSKSVNDKEDLAKESAKMRDDVVSESLAKIFASQGKTEKAIEIYKKLIWKLPQKKALFAAQIEKLKKK
ncbi:MAG: hypothetical protein KDC79_14320 [Cyclobacteriaceae bacterium]|nr:hypothetical protein [Cyclobacteriaceae bacterium]